ncbi:I78 family peptidase inhibitor [Methylosinus sp. PW1]|uniref:I78 family peptidase inhibitor n=1 Tax=Methylosinus sp. PW1 TaxID=107636 RepID=UPI00068B3BB6
MSSRRHELSSLARRICAFVLVAACFVPGLSRAAEGCNAKNALFVVGKPFGGDLADEARRRAGAKIVRRMDRGMAYTMEFRTDRLDLAVDKKGIVVAVHCG